MEVEMNGTENHEMEALAAAMADEAVKDLPLDDEARLQLACLLEIDLLVDPALAGVLQTELAQRKHLGPSGTVMKGDDATVQIAPALVANLKKR